MANLSKADIARRLKAHIEAHEPFVAYWHPNGHGVMLTEPKRVKRRAPRSTVMETVTLSFTKELRRDYDRAMHKLRRRTYTFDIITVEFDGENISMEGDLELL